MKHLALTCLAHWSYDCNRSPMEHHHLATLFKLLKVPSYNILQRLPKDERVKIRKVWRTHWKRIRTP